MSKHKGANYVNLKLDVVFKSFFTNENNRELLISFIASVLEIPAESITDIQIKNPEISVTSLDDKFSRLDLNLKVDDKNVNVELQVHKEEYYKERSVFYWSCLYDDLKRGESYGTLPDAISIHILDHKMFDCDEYQSTFTFMEKKRHEILTNKCAIHYFELPKIPQKINPNNMKEMWMQLIDADNESDLEKIEKVGNNVMNRAIRVIYGMQGDEKVKEEARMRQKALNDMYSSLSIAEEKGRAEGRAEGEQSAIQKINLLTQELIKSNRISELAKALQNNDLLQKLFKEFNIN